MISKFDRSKIEVHRVNMSPVDNSMCRSLESCQRHVDPPFICRILCMWHSQKCECPRRTKIFLISWCPSSSSFSTISYVFSSWPSPHRPICSSISMLGQHPRPHRHSPAFAKKHACSFQVAGRDLTKGIHWRRASRHWKPPAGSRIRYCRVSISNSRSPI